MNIFAKVNNVIGKFLQPNQKQNNAYSKQALPTTTKKIKSPQETEKLYHNYRYNLLRKKYRKLATSATGSAIINRLIEGVIGAGLTLRANPMSDLLPFNVDITKWEKNVEDLFLLFTNEKEISSSNTQTLSELQRNVLREMLIAGEVFIAFSYSDDNNRLSPINIHIIPAEKINQGNSEEAQKRGHILYNSIEYKGLEEVGCWIYQKNTESYQYFNYIDTETGLPIVLHFAIKQEAHHNRGVSPLYNVMVEIEKKTEYIDSELQAAALNALFALTIESNVNAIEHSDVNIGSIVEKQYANDEELAADILKNNKIEKNININKAWIDSGAIVQGLPPGYTFKSHDTSRPNVNAKDFLSLIDEEIGAAIGIPSRILKEHLDKSYSAARGEMQLLARTINIYKDRLIQAFLSPLYKTWLYIEIKRENINAPEFDSNRKIMQAWLHHNWIGAGAVDLDPLKTVKAHVIQVENGFTTRESIAQQTNGETYATNIERLKKENELLAKANKSILNNENIIKQESING